MRVLVAMSGGVDSSVAAALLIEAGHKVTGVTMKLWGGPSDSGCCSVADVDDAARVAQQLGISHHVANFSAEFDRDVVDPYVAAHAAGRTPNPCVACNRHLKFDRLLRRAEQMGFDAVATGHYAKIERSAPDGDGWVLRRGADPAKDQSYVLHMLGQRELSRVLLPVGHLPKAEVRARAGELGLRTAAKPDSQDVCFISRSGGREAFLGARIPLRPGRVVDGEGHPVGTVPAVELVTVGQRRGLGHTTGPPTRADRRYALGVDVAAATVTVGSLEDLMTSTVEVTGVTWCGARPAPGSPVEVQSSAHGAPVGAVWDGVATLAMSAPVRLVAPGQSVVLYDRDRVLGGGIAT
ncbi:tRNA 2-thiouridine(34) synthase MnmA [Acidiferrimicrobium sp. IK]|uniref:tRNA 2-thiouridine(34) synthase MnmA n=1 Tax=Acidiferrimicrobium sp. IK TaxID=2871700 RepID=UPI0021CB84EE|nr:tRNA 2-thiouridine(34) synthase MnmA [Acidiferrimicrobium sp. IK]MCU4186516.1 tRNA 2-thiouridine(34) synthase MnmA [Acidiferrimicrobium sp. IK]